MNQKYIQNSRGGQMHHHELYPLLGLKVGQHLPEDGVSMHVIQGMQVYVAPKGLGDPAAKVKSPHRVMVVCQCGCNRDIPFGRMRQHLKITKRASGRWV